VTVVGAPTVKVQVPVPVQPAPLQPLNTEPPGAWVSVTTVPTANEPLQVAPQVMPGGDEVTEALPARSPVLAIVMVTMDSVNVAVTDCAEVIATEQVPVPLHPPPLQPVNVEPAPAAAVRVTTVGATKGAVQVAPQLMPAGLEVTVPVPVPARETVRL
jgi:hypothetical protein